MTRVIITVILLALLPGCASCERSDPGEFFYKRTTATDPATGIVYEHVEVNGRNDGNPKGGVTVNVNGDGSVTSSTGGAWGIDQAIAQLKPLTWLGAGLIIIGVGSIVARRWFPIIPITASYAGILTGIAFLFIPTAFDRYSHWIMLGGVSTVAVLYLVGAFDNAKHRGKPAPKPQAGATS